LKNASTASTRLGLQQKAEKAIKPACTERFSLLQLMADLTPQAPCRKLAPRTSIIAPNAAIQSSDGHLAAFLFTVLPLPLEGYLCFRGVSTPKFLSIASKYKGRQTGRCGVGREENRFPDLHLLSIVLINRHTCIYPDLIFARKRRDKKGMNSFDLPSPLTTLQPSCKRTQTLS
jgi:hypothetical protein